MKGASGVVREIGLPCRSAFIAAFVAFCVLSTHEAWAEDAAEQAKAHFLRAVELSDQGKLKDAVAEFELAYRTRPHFAVLYNIGLTYVRLDRPVQAIKAFERYLSEGGERVTAERRDAVERELARQRQLTALLSITTDPAAALVSVDAASARTSPLIPPIRLPHGSHEVRVELQGYRTARLDVRLRAGEERHLHVQLTDQATELPEVGQLPITCSLLDVTILSDGNPVGRTPLDTPVLLAAGRHEIRFERPGYSPFSRTIEIRGGSAARPLDCRMRVAPRLPSQAAARLEVRPSEEGARVLVDGTALDGEALRLPSGRHMVEVRRPGFAVWSGVVTLQPEESALLEASLEPTKEHATWVARARQRRRWAYGLGIAGVGLGATALVTTLWNDGRFRDWRRTQENLDATWDEGPPYPEDLDERQSENDGLARSLHRYDKMNVGLGVAAACITTAGGALLATGRRPERRVEVTMTAEPSGAGAIWRTAW